MTVHAGFNRAGLVAGAAVVGLALSACSSSSDDAESSESASASTETTLSGSLAGAGASSQESAMEAWRAGFQELYPDVTVTYDAVGSGAGITQFIDEAVSWAGSDAPLEDDEITDANARCASGEAWNLPVYISPIAVVFNLEGIDSLNLDPETIAKIFRGEITTWNDEEIAATNEGVDLPDTAITVVHRSDESGTTENFTEYLYEAAPDVWTDEPDKAWPISGGESGQGTSGLVQAVQGGEGTIGYADASQAGDLGTVALKAGDSYVSFSNETAAAAAENATQEERDSEYDIALTIDRVPDDSESYPLILVSYSIVCSGYEDDNEAELVKAFVSYQVSEEGQEAASSAAGSAPISDTLRDQVLASVEQIQQG